MTTHSVSQGSLIAILPQQGNLTKTAWELPATMAEGDWKAAGHALSQVEGAMNWWLGDWWRFGEMQLFNNWRLADPDYEVALLLGNQAQHRNSFIVISVLPAKKRAGIPSREVSYQADFLELAA